MVKWGESRTANSDRGLVLGVGGLGKPNLGRGRRENFFPDSGSDRDSDKTFQISRNLGLEHVEFVCLLDSQLCLKRNKVILWNSERNGMTCGEKQTLWN